MSNGTERPEEAFVGSGLREYTDEEVEETLFSALRPVFIPGDVFERPEFYVPGGVTTEGRAVLEELLPRVSEGYAAVVELGNAGVYSSKYSHDVGDARRVLGLVEAGAYIAVKDPEDYPGRVEGSGIATTEPLNTALLDARRLYKSLVAKHRPEVAA
jgi:hypothetical protein